MRRIVFMHPYAWFCPIFVFLISCSQDSMTTDIRTGRIENNDIELNISTFRDEVLFSSDSIPAIKLRNGSEGSSSVEVKEVETSETVVFPQLFQHIWLGSILRKSSIANALYAPLIYNNRTPLKIISTLPGAGSAIMESPSLTNYMPLLNKFVKEGSFKQNGEFVFSIEKFTSYNELKTAFGSNINTGALFWGSHTGTSGETYQIQKATGLYVKFYQSSFRVMMDPPVNGFPEVPQNMLDDAVYVNSITYGRMGILTIETNDSYEYAYEKIGKVFNKIFLSGNNQYTKEEKDFLNRSEFKVYLISGSGQTASVVPFSGYDGFIRHIVSGRFSKDIPGDPLFCSFNHVRDNTPVRIKFKYSIKKAPVYTELVMKNGDGVYLYFYRNKSKIPTIAHPRIKFSIKKTEQINFSPSPYAGDFGYDPEKILYEEKDFYNTGYQTSIKLYNLPKLYQEIYVGETGHGAPCYLQNRYEIILNKTNDFEIIGTNKLSSAGN